MDAYLSIEDFILFSKNSKEKLYNLVAFLTAVIDGDLWFGVFLCLRIKMVKKLNIYSNKGKKWEGKKYREEEELKREKGNRNDRIEWGGDKEKEQKIKDRTTECVRK